jgi:hypothetical protein
MRDLRKLIDGYRNTALIYTAVKLDLPDTMDTSAVNAEQLASLIDGSAPHLARLLDALVPAGICDRSADGSYTLTESGLSLRRNSASPHRELVEIAVEQYWSPWTHLELSVRTGEPAFEHLHGMGVFEWRRANPGANELFNSWLAKETDIVVNAIIEATDFSGTERIADIGGGNGSLLAAALTQYPHLTGTLFDQAHVIEQAKKHLGETRVFSRMEFCAGDFFTGIPVKADTYMLKSVLHDWTDEKAITILKCCRVTAANDTRLMLVERLLGRSNSNAETNTMVDIHMMAVTGGRERSLEEYRVLLTKSGFTLSKVSATAPGFHIMEATPA